ncbi:hypothetical protein HU200_008801 [Digitaria exilis]|uniref:Nuclear transcription factor Y subunit n=1 Tax=Digitaria exilis TaxID=1010633 RepID=A0A835FKS1_9POAL|nr:hypothetical protein HU200_008801 [Digitaria exilis]
MSVEDNGSSEMVAGQPIAVGRKLLPPITPGGTQVFVSEKQYDAIIRLRERRRRVKEARERRALRVKKHVPRDPKGRFIKSKGKQEGTNGGIMVPFSATLNHCYLRLITTNGYQEVTTIGSDAQSSTPAIGFYLPFVPTNEGGENVGEVICDSIAQSSTPPVGLYCPLVATNESGESLGEVMYWPLLATNVCEVANDSEAPSNTPGMGFYWPFTAASEYDENIGEAASGSKAPFSNPAGDFFWPIVATNDEEENVGEFAYDNILNLESPYPTTLLRIMMGNRYNTDPVSAQFQNVAQLQAPDFTTLLTIMNNAGYDEAADNGHYDVDEVMTKLEGW